MQTKYALITLTLVVLVALTAGCTGTTTTTVPTTNVPTANAPSADPVIGSWTFKMMFDPSLVAQYNMTVAGLTTTYAFDADKSYHAVMDTADSSPITGNGTWANAGNGLYKVSFDSSDDVFFRMENGKLYCVNDSTDTSRTMECVRTT
jgi:hypothetical protein